MGDQPQSADRVNAERYRVLSTRTMWFAAGLILVVGLGAGAWLIAALGSGDPSSAGKLDAIRIACTIVIGTGGGVGLLLAARRQRSTEIGLRQKEREQQLQQELADNTFEDTLARRITELYTKAADQLGSASAVVRLAGIYALERLGQENPSQRQMVANLLCAYLRLPSPGSMKDLSDELEPEEVPGQERQVRIAAQDVLSSRLRAVADVGSARFWEDIDLDLSGATLYDVNFAGCVFRNVKMQQTRFVGHAHFGRARVEGIAWFYGCKFSDEVWFTESRFDDDAVFTECQFIGPASFQGAVFSGRAEIANARFDNEVRFEYSQFDGDVIYVKSRFMSGAVFDHMSIEGSTSFDEVEFLGYATLARCVLRGQSSFEVAHFCGVPMIDGTNFYGDVSFGSALLEEGIDYDRAVFHGHLIRHDESEPA